MNPGENLDLLSLLMASSLVLVSLFFSYWQKLKLEKEIIIGSLRAVIQLVLVGYVLEYVFSYKSPMFTSLLLLFMIFNAAFNASRRGKGIKRVFFVSFLSIFLATIFTILVLVLSKTLSYEAYQIIPVSGMILGSSMVSIGLCYKQLKNDF